MWRLQRERRVFDVLANTGLVLVSVLGGLLLAEGAVRLFSPIGPALLVHDEKGKHYVPGFSGAVFVDEAGRAVDLRFNKEGFRGPEWPKNKPQGVLRVAVIGDSMTAALATDEEKTFVRRLEVNLAARLGRSVGAMNLGVSSASTATELLTWRRVASAYAPDVVLLAFFTGNDFGDNSRKLTRAPRFYFDLDERGALVAGPEPGATPAFTRWLDLHSRFYVWQKVAFRQLRGASRSAAGIEAGQRIFAVDDEPDGEAAWRLTESLIRQMQGEVEAAGARFGLVVIPCAEQVDDRLWGDLLARAAAAGYRLDREAPSRRLGAIAARGGIPLLDLAAAFGVSARRRDPSRASAADLYLMGRFHLSDEGNKVVAEELGRFVAASLLAPESSSQ